MLPSLFTQLIWISGKENVSLMTLALQPIIIFITLLSNCITYELGIFLNTVFGLVWRWWPFDFISNVAAKMLAVCISCSCLVLGNVTSKNWTFECFKLTSNKNLIKIGLKLCYCMERLMNNCNICNIIVIYAKKVSKISESQRMPHTFEVTPSHFLFCPTSSLKYTINTHIKLRKATFLLHLTSWNQHMFDI